MGRHYEDTKYLIEDKITRFYVKGLEEDEFQMTSNVYDAWMDSDKEKADTFLKRLDYNKFEVVEHIFYYE